MQKTTNKRTRRLLFLFSRTGGGHHSVASAVAQILQDLHGEQVQIKLLDALADYAPWPINQSSTIYPYMAQLKGLPWAAVYRLTNGPRQAALITRICWPWVRAASFRLVRENPADAVIACHPFLNHPIIRALAKSAHRSPFITLVTDLVVTHDVWFSPEADWCIVPTEPLRQQALTCGLPAERIQVTGLPIHPRFVKITEKDPAAVQQRLGLEPGLPVILLVSGAEGMGTPYRLCKAIAESDTRAQLAVITGRNAQLQAKLSAETWPLPVKVEGFVHNMHEWMRAADLLVTKAGPTTICEALIMGLPIVLSGALPGQETPNVDYVVQSGAGVWAPTPQKVAAAVHEALAPGNPAFAQMAARARALAQPDAARRVAEIVWRIAGGESA